MNIRTLASPPLRPLKHTDIHAHNFAYSPHLDISLDSLTLSAFETEAFVELLLLYRSTSPTVNSWPYKHAIQQRTETSEWVATALVFGSLQVYIPPSDNGCRG